MWALITSTNCQDELVKNIYDLNHGFVEPEIVFDYRTGVTKSVEDLRSIAISDFKRNKSAHVKLIDMSIPIQTQQLPSNFQPKNICEARLILMREGIKSPQYYFHSNGFPLTTVSEILNVN